MQKPQESQLFLMDRKVLAQPTTVEYDSRKKRVRKTLPDNWAARRFYAHKLREGKRPRIIQQPTSKTSKTFLHPSVVSEILRDVVLQSTSPRSRRGSLPKSRLQRSSNPR